MFYTFSIEDHHECLGQVTIPSNDPAEALHQWFLAGNDITESTGAALMGPYAVPADPASLNDCEACQ